MIIFRYLAFALGIYVLVVDTLNLIGYMPFAGSDYKPSFLPARIILSTVLGLVGFLLVFPYRKLRGETTRVLFGIALGMATGFVILVVLVGTSVSSGPIVIALLLAGAAIVILNFVYYLKLSKRKKPPILPKKSEYPSV